jgi:hypothetical protein
MRGTDTETERRKIRPQDRLDGFWKLADDLGTGGAEVLFLSLPGLVLLLNAVPYRRGPMAFAAITALVATGAGAGVLGGGWLTLDPPWPAWSVSTTLYRVVYYSVGMFVLGLGGAAVLVATGTLVAAVVVGLGGLLLAGVLPRLFALSGRTVRYVRAWHRYLFGPADPPTF